MRVLGGFKGFLSTVSNKIAVFKDMSLAQRECCTYIFSGDAWDKIPPSW